MLWRLFAVNAAVFAVAFAVLALVPVTVHTPIRLDELVILLVGLIAMLAADLLLLRQTLLPLGRLATLMGSVDPLHPGQRATGFDQSSSELLTLADAFNEMLARLEAERRESSSRVLAAQEAERLRIARELHDEIGQTLTAVALRAEHASGRPGPESAELGELAQIVQQTLEDVRRIVRELRPEALDDLGLANALIALCSRVDRQGALRVYRQIAGQPAQLSADAELAIYRVAQEALTNTVRHSGATEVTVSLARSDGEVELTVADNGAGFPEHPSAGAGLASMRERAMLIGAELSIDSSPGAGVRVRLRVAGSA
jgi:two-component system sensor histidine kinase UhpB